MEEVVVVEVEEDEENKQQEQEQESRPNAVSAREREGEQSAKGGRCLAAAPSTQYKLQWPTGPTIDWLGGGGRYDGRYVCR